MSSEVAVEMYVDRWKRYPAYRDSGVEWLGEVPEGWITKKIKHTTYVKGRIGWKGLKSDEFIGEGPYLVTGTDFIEGKVNWETCYHVSNERYDEDPYIQLHENDLLITKDGTIGKTAIVKNLPDNACLNSGIFLTRSISGDYFTEFMHWLLNSVVFTKFIDYTKTGTTINHLYQNVFVDFTFPVPPLPEQHTIAAFLDSETGRIDALIEKKERQIELLQEKRAALISHAVTKGLDPDVPMKDSGVEWLDEVPENWEIKRLKHVCLLIKDGTHQPPSRTSNGIPLLSVRNIVNGKFVNLPDDSLISEEDFNELQRSVEVKKNDILLAIVGATIGKVAIVDEMLPFAIQRSLAVLRPNINIAYYKYFSYFMRSSSFQQLLWKNVGYSAQPGIYLGSLANFNITVPDTNEQRAIASFIDRETGRIDTLTTKVRESVSKLREYRTALISAAVTGKIDVRNKET